MFKLNTVMFVIFLLIQCVICRNIRENNENINNNNSSVISFSDNKNSASLLINNVEQAKTFEIFSDQDNDENVEDKSDDTDLTDISEGRTYVHHFAKRMAVLLLPLMFKLGVVMTMLAFLTVISVKSLIVGVGLMVVGLSHVLARAYQASVQPSVIPSSPLLVNPYAGLLRAPIPPGLAGWEKRSSNVPAPRSHDPHRDAYSKQYAQPASNPQVSNVVDLQSASTNHGTASYYVLNSGPDAGVIQTYH